jgi:hypothetical protein
MCACLPFVNHPVSKREGTFKEAAYLKHLGAEDAAALFANVAAVGA